MFSLTGLIVGAIVGLTGVGGGSLMTPILTLMFGIKPNISIGTDLVFACLTKGVDTVVHGIRGTVRWVSSVLIGVLALTGLKLIW